MHLGPSPFFSRSLSLLLTYLLPHRSFPLTDSCQFRRSYPLVKIKQGKFIFSFNYSCRCCGSHRSRINDLNYRLVEFIFWCLPSESFNLEMSEKGLIYSFVAKGTVVLAEHTSYTGNFSTIAVQCLQKLPSNSSKYTYSCDGHTFNFLVDNGFVFLVVADESTGRTVPFVFLDRVKDDFKQRYGSSIKNNEPHPLEDDDEDDYLFEDRFSIAYNLDREFGPKLKEHMEYCMSHPEEMSKLAKLKAQITEVKGIMMDNIEKVLDRGEKIELLVDKTENLQFQADSFQRQGRQLRRKMWLQNLQIKLMVGGAILSFVVMVWVIACGGFKCS